MRFSRSIRFFFNKRRLASLSAPFNQSTGTVTIFSLVILTLAGLLI